jgi:hypothetical protein
MDRDVEIIGEDIDLSSFPGFLNITQWIEGFCTDRINAAYDEERCREILSLDNSTIMHLDQNECFAYATTLMNYASYLQKKVATLRSQYSWCEDGLNYVFSKSWMNYDKWMPAEVRKQAIISENIYAATLNKIRIRIYAAIQLTEDECKDIKRRVNIFQEFGNARRFQ